MLGLLPHYIALKHKNNQSHGTFDACALYLDIGGFTRLTEELMQKGLAGAEELSSIINLLFTPVIDSIYSAEGFISTFAGDGISAFFPAKDPSPALSATLHIASEFQRVTASRSSFLLSNLFPRIALTRGSVEWGILGSGKKHAYYFHCPALIEAASALQGTRDGKAHITSSLWSSFTFSRTNELEFTALSGLSPVSPIPPIDRKTASSFFDAPLLKGTITKEFRDVASVFIAFQATDHMSLNSFASVVINETQRFGGYISSLEFTEKGPLFLVVFGAPVSYENNTARALSFLLSLRQQSSISYKAGATFGSVYAGIVGSRRRCAYTVLGDAVNLAARLVYAAKDQEILANTKFMQNAGNKVDWEDMGKRHVKGKLMEVNVHMYIRSHEETELTFFTGKLVGRKNELRKLKTWIKPIYENRSAGIIYLYGEPGVGKSRLVYHLARSLPENTMIIAMQADEVLRKSLNPFARALKQIIGLSQTASDETNLSTLNQYINGLLKKTNDSTHVAKEMHRDLQRQKVYLQALLGLSVLETDFTGLDPKERFENTLYAIKTIIKILALSNPVLLIIDDFQWLDDDSKKALSTLTRNIADTPLAVVVCSRLLDDGTQPIFQHSDDATVHETELQTFLKDEQEELIVQSLNSKANPTLLEFIRTRSEGNPFFIEQICSYLQENDLLKSSIAGLTLKQVKLELPSSIRAVVIARLDRLTSDVKELVQTASVLGNEFNVRILSTMLKGKTIDGILATGEEQRIWYTINKLFYLFFHTLFRDAAYEMQMRLRLKALHRSAAEAFEKLYLDNPDFYSEMAYHYEQAEVKTKARLFLQKAAEHARNGYRNQEALNLYSRLLPYLDSFSARMELSGRMVEILQLVGRWDEAENTLRNDLCQVENTSDAQLLANKQYALGSLLVLRGDREEAQTLLNSALCYYTSVGDKTHMAGVFGQLGSLCWRKGVFDEAKLNYEKQMELEKELGNEAGVGQALGSIGSIYITQGKNPEALDYCTRTLEIAQRLSVKRLLCTVLGNLGVIHKNMNQLEMAMSYYEQQLAIAEEMGDKRNIGIVTGNIGVLYGYMDDPVSEEKAYNRKLEIAEEMGDRYSIAIALGNLSNIYTDRGVYAEASKLLDRAIKLFESMGDKMGLSIALGNLADVQWCLGKREQAVANYLRQLELAQELEDSIGIVFGKASLGKLYLLMNKTEQARNYLQQAIDDGKSLQVDYYLCEALIYLTDLLEQSGENDKARIHLNEARELAEKIHRNDCLLDVQILEAHLMAHTNKEEASAIILAAVKNAKDEENLARLRYELWRLTQQQTDRQQAYHAYKALYEHIPNHDFQLRLSELK